MFREFAPEVTTNLDFELMEYYTHKFRNNCSLFHFPYSDFELTKVNFIFSAGKWQQSQSLVSYFTAKMLTEGTHKLTDEQIATQFDELGASIIINSGADDVNISICCINRNIEKALSLFHEIITNSCFPEKQLSIMLQNHKQEFLINLDRVSFIANREIYKAIYGIKHPYGKINEIDDYDKINSTLIFEFYKKHYCFDNCKIVWTGSLSNTNLHFLENHFGVTTTNAQISEKNFLLNPNNKETIFIEKENVKQSAISIGKEFPLKTHKDFIKLSFVNTILGGYFGSRLMKNIREEKGLTYGIGSGIISNKKSSNFYISTQVNAENTILAINEIKNEIVKLQTELVDDFELELVRNYLFGIITQTLDGPFSQSQFCILAIDSNLNPKDRLRQIIEDFKNIDKQTIIELANKYLDIKTLKYIIVGKK